MLWAIARSCYQCYHSLSRSRVTAVQVGGRWAAATAEYFGPHSCRHCVAWRTAYDDERSKTISVNQRDFAVRAISCRRVFRYLRFGSSPIAVAYGVVPLPHYILIVSAYRVVFRTARATCQQLCLDGECAALPWKFRLEDGRKEKRQTPTGRSEFFRCGGPRAECGTWRSRVDGPSTRLPVGGEVRIGKLDRWPGCPP